MVLGVKMSGQSHSHFYFLIKYTYLKKDPNLTGFWTILPKNVDFSKSFADKAWYLYIFWKNIRGGNFIQKISFLVKLFWELGWGRVVFTPSPSSLVFNIHKGPMFNRVITCFSSINEICEMNNSLQRNG